MKRVLLLTVFLSSTPLAFAEIYKLAVPSDQGLQLYWWPILPDIPGWRHDEGASCAQGVNALVPDGQSFSGAPAIIYARAMFKPRMPDVKSLRQLIDEDRAGFERDFPGISIQELKPIKDGDAKMHPYFSYSPRGEGSWELVAYGEENDFYLLFTLSGNSKPALESARADFERLVATYRARLAAHTKSRVSRVGSKREMILSESSSPLYRTGDFVRWLSAA